ncbi:MAG: hypothetical protein OMM_07588 [Candidatus Magnetoglobus multicellularis str. Araruama]|uniref:Uncharacterized protein n=1 Tax=Candidatus Magnetoglobus multicellularis str. Araruama TaxID=890399 RepID=A0A1V1PC92_9BACT|nr:MAG: hypothetical protein OMM_07588 [Candidatus Magnetoglobus multicellularis str. Araruama]
MVRNKKQYPNKFILIGDILEEMISVTQSKIIEGKILKVSDSAKEIREAYLYEKKQGKEVLYTLPSTPEEFYVENVPYKGIIR